MTDRSEYVFLPLFDSSFDDTVSLKCNALSTVLGDFKFHYLTLIIIIFTTDFTIKILLVVAVLVVVEVVC